MSRGLDLIKAEAAFRRAAYKALHGTREERSGKFLPKKDRPTDDMAKRKANSRAG